MTHRGVVEFGVGDGGPEALVGDAVALEDRVGDDGTRVRHVARHVALQCVCALLQHRYLKLSGFDLKHFTLNQ